MSGDIVVVGGTSHPELIKSICEKLNIQQTKSNIKKFANGETSIQILESVREKDVFVIQSGCGHVNDNFMQLLILISSCKIASCNRITVVMPYFCYSRQADIPFLANGTPKMTNTSSIESLSDISNSGKKLFVSQNGTLIANLLTTAGADHVITMDLHDPQFQGFFNIAVDNLYSRPILEDYIKWEIDDYKLDVDNFVIVSPDAGGAKRATKIADSLGVSFAMIHKEKKMRVPVVIDSAPIMQRQDSIANMSKYITTTMLVGDVNGKTCIMIDDLVDTGYTMLRAAKLLKQQKCKKLIIVITHGIFSGDAVTRIVESNKQFNLIDKLIVTNTIPQNDHVEKFSAGGIDCKVLDVSTVFSEAIRRIHNGESISSLFERGWH
ncbi:hypothetical protein QEN19_003612 [Hanseniaspora menglaensis]